MILPNVRLDEFYHIIKKKKRFRLKTGDPHVRAWPTPLFKKCIYVRIGRFYPEMQLWHFVYLDLIKTKKIKKKFAKIA